MSTPSWNEAGIPIELRQIAHWLVWKGEKRGDKWTKVPYRALTSGQVPASTTDADTWADYRAAVAVAARFDGLGFVFSSDDQYFGIDLDGCRNPETGEIAPWAQAIIDAIDSYREITPSGRGIHIIGKGKLPPGRRREGPIEMYDMGRYFTMTGWRLPDCPDPKECGEALQRLHARVFPTEPERSHPVTRRYNGAAPEDEAVLRMVCRLPAYAALWRGDHSAYDSPSEADLALCGRIAFFVGPDPLGVDRVFRQSGLYREKWDDPHHGRQGTTYGQGTVAKALAGKSQFFDWGKPAASAPVASVAMKTPDPFVVSVVRRNEKTVPKPPVELAPEALYGLPGEVVRAIDPHTESHPAAVLASFITGMGCLLGRRPHVFRDGGRQTANEFAVLVGLSAVGRKGTATRRVEEILNCLSDCNSTKTMRHDMHVMREDKEESLYETLRLSGLGSGEAMVEALADKESDKRRIVVEEEFSRCLKVMRREGSTLSDTFRSAWDGGVLSNRTKGKHYRAVGSHVSILGHITEAELKEELANTSIYNGFANRFLWFCCGRSKSLPRGGGKIPSALIVQKLQAALAFARNLDQVEFNEPVMAAWDQGGIYDRLNAETPGLLGAVTSRAAAHVTRLALFWMCLDMEGEVNEDHLLAALATWDYSVASSRFLFGQSTGDDAADRIEEGLGEVAPGGLDRTQIRDLFNRNARPGVIPIALSLLERLGRAEMRRLDTPGRPCEVWFSKTATTDDGNDQNDGNDKSPHDKNDKSPLCLARALFGR